MALVTLENVGSVDIYTIKTSFVDLTVNSLFTFLNTLNPSNGNDFRLSLDDGVSWGSWQDLTDVNIRSIEVDRGIKLVAQVRLASFESYLLINDGGDTLLINDDDESLLIS